MKIKKIIQMFVFTFLLTGILISPIVNAQSFDLNSDECNSPGTLLYGRECKEITFFDTLFGNLFSTVGEFAINYNTGVATCYPYTQLFEIYGWGSYGSCQGWVSNVGGGICNKPENLAQCESQTCQPAGPVSGSISECYASGGSGTPKNTVRQAYNDGNCGSYYKTLDTCSSGEVCTDSSTGASCKTSTTGGTTTKKSVGQSCIYDSDCTTDYCAFFQCSNPASYVCGDKICQSTETFTSCPVDCTGGGTGIQTPVCGDNICSVGETYGASYYCEEDCGGETPEITPLHTQTSLTEEEFNLGTNDLILSAMCDNSNQCESREGYTVTCSRTAAVQDRNYEAASNQCPGFFQGGGIIGAAICDPIKLFFGAKNLYNVFDVKDGTCRAELEKTGNFLEDELFKVGDYSVTGLTAIIIAFAIFIFVSVLPKRN